MKKISHNLTDITCRSCNYNKPEDFFNGGKGHIGDLNGIWIICPDCLAGTLYIGPRKALKALNQKGVESS